MYNIYTDGAYSHLMDKGGYAYIILKDDAILCEGSGHYDHTTNNQMELMAIIKALSRIKESSDITVFSDSQYVISIATGKASIRKNKLLWNTYFNYAQKHNINYIHIKGHSGNKYNEWCDRLATQNGNITDNKQRGCIS